MCAFDGDKEVEKFWNFDPVTFTLATLRPGDFYGMTHTSECRNLLRSSEMSLRCIAVCSFCGLQQWNSFVFSTLYRSGYKQTPFIPCPYKYICLAPWNIVHWIYWKEYSSTNWCRMFTLTFANLLETRTKYN
jgi:hypothetical protein